MSELSTKQQRKASRKAAKLVRQGMKEVSYVLYAKQLDKEGRIVARQALKRKV
jgi:hypothetical protein